MKKYSPFEAQLKQLEQSGKIGLEQIDEIRQKTLDIVTMLWDAKDGRLFKKEVLNAERLRAVINGEIEIPEGDVDGTAKVLEGDFRK